MSKEQAALVAAARGKSARAIAKDLGISRGTALLLKHTARRGGSARARPQNLDALPVVPAHRCVQCGGLIVNEQCQACAAAAGDPTPLPVAQPAASCFDARLRGRDLATGAVYRYRAVFCRKCQADPLRILQARNAAPVLCPLSTASEMRTIGQPPCPLASNQRSAVSGQQSGARSQEPGT